jgi:hypothetical protein
MDIDKVSVLLTFTGNHSGSKVNPTELEPSNSSIYKEPIYARTSEREN